MKFKKMVRVGVDEEGLSESCIKKLDSLAEKTVFIPRGNDITPHLSDADCLLVGFQIPVTKREVDAAPRLKFIGVLATAYGTIDVAYAKSKGVIVCNLPGYSTQAVAEFTFAALLDVYRNLEDARQRGREGINYPLGTKGTEVRGKRFGVLGLGRIGSRVAEIAAGLDADVSYWSRTRKPQLESRGIRYQDADTLIAECDVVSINFAEAPETKNFMNASRINNLKSGSVLIKTVPVSTVDVSALETRLSRGEVTFIFENNEDTPPEVFQRLAAHKNSIIYPPIAFATKESAARREEMFISNIETFLKGTPTNML